MISIFQATSHEDLTAEGRMRVQQQPPQTPKDPYGHNIYAVSTYQGPAVQGEPRGHTPLYFSMDIGVKLLTLKTVIAQFFAQKTLAMSNISRDLTSHALVV